MSRAITRHHALLREAISANHGFTFEVIGDAFCAVFSSPTDALNAALAIQRTLQAEPWPEEVNPIRVRLVLYAGPSERYEHSYSSYTLNRVARFLSTAHGGQIILSQATVEGLKNKLPPQAALLDLGVHRLKDLINLEHIFQLTVPDLPSSFPPLKTLTPLRTNLPIQPTSFIGRQAEMAEIKRIMQKTRLLTLTGTGGTGKTRLALEVAAELVDSFKAGVWLVELAPLIESSAVARAVAVALGVREQPGKHLLDSLTDYLQDKSLLLLVDNCEHLLEPVAVLIEQLLRVSPDLRVLATSREPLAIAGENTLHVPSLSLPESQTEVDLQALEQVEAVRLFVERVQAVEPSFTLTGQNVSAITGICRRLDGIPLALELAAVRVRELSLEQLVQRLDRRFSLLTKGNRTALPRQQTLRALIDWSYDLLNSKEQALFRGLAVFFNGWSLEAVEAIWAAINPNLESEEFEALDLLVQLVRKSVVIAEKTSESERYRFLETIRQYALEKLAQAQEESRLRVAYCAYFVEKAERAEQALAGKEQVKYLAWFDREYDNLKGALNWCLEENSPADLRLAGIRLCLALSYYWELRGFFTEGRLYLSRALALKGDLESLLRAKTLSRLGRLAYNQGEYDVAWDYYSEALKQASAAGDSPAVATSLAGLGNVAYNQGKIEDSRKYHQQSLDLWQQIEDKGAIAVSFNSLGSIADRLGDHELARRYYLQSLALRQELGDKRGIAISLNNLGALANARGEYRAAQKYFEDSLPLRQELGDKRGIAIGLNNLGIIANVQGNFEEASQFYHASLALFREMADTEGIIHALTGLGSVSYEKQKLGEAEKYYRESVALAQKVGENQSIIVNLVELANVSFKQGEINETEAEVFFGRAAALCGAVISLLDKTGVTLDLDEQIKYSRTVEALRSKLAAESFNSYFSLGKARGADLTLTLGED